MSTRFETCAFGSVVELIVVKCHLPLILPPAKKTFEPNVTAVREDLASDKLSLLHE
jgi:hypothetical protein